MRWLREKKLSFKVWLLALACARLRNRSIDYIPSRIDILLLAMAWGNIGYAAGFSYLRRVGERVIKSRGPILECGSGATTLLIAALTQNTQRSFMILEHNKAWFDHIQRILGKLGFTHVELTHAPLVDYGSYRWYDTPGHEEIHNFNLVICDGPPGSIPGGRYGLLPIMGGQLAQDCIILLDDTHRKAEQHIITSWRKQRCLRASRLGYFGTYSEVEFC